MNLETQFLQQRIPNGYELVDGVAMHRQNGQRFQIPHPVLKTHVQTGHFVELRVDSPRFSTHEDAPEVCTCPACNEETPKPILRHQQPASLVPIPHQPVPSRGWGEDFWVRVADRDGLYLLGVVDNPLYEARLHELRQGDEIVFHQDHVLAIHDIHRRELVSRMNPDELKQLAEWLGSLRK